MTRLEKGGAGATRRFALVLLNLSGGVLCFAQVSGVDLSRTPPAERPVDSVNQREHWAFRPLLRPVPPSVNEKAMVRNAIDCFVLARLEGTRLAFSPEADRRTLIRRLYLDVLGLPPGPEQMREFLQDTGANAYERLVDRLLASPHYGERWARHWLDVVRFAETHGFETNTPRDHAWPYRDYVIRSFNEDKPYTQFIVEQLAGDALGADEATGFIVGGPWDEVKSPDVVLTANQRADELHDMVATTSSAFLGLTVGCARCHDHKFDPIPQRDYYAVKAAFAGVQHGDRKLKTADSEKRLREAEVLRAELNQIEGQLTQFEPLAKPQQKTLERPSAHVNEDVFEPVEAEWVRFTIHQTAFHETLGEIEPCIDELEIHSAGEQSRNVALASAGAKATASGTFPNSELHKLEHINDGKHGNGHSWISNEKGRGWVQIQLPDKIRIDRIVWGRDREQKFKDRLPISYTIEVGTERSAGVPSAPSMPGPMAWRQVAHRPPLRPAVHSRQNVDRFAPVSARFLRLTILETTGLEPCIDELEIYTADGSPRNVALAGAGARASASSVYPNSPLHKLEHLNDGFYGNSRSWISSETGQGWVQIEFPDIVAINKVVWGRDREEKYSDRLATQYRIEVGLATNDWIVVASASDRQRFVPGQKFKPAYVATGLTEAEAARLSKLLEERRTLETKIKELTAGPKVYAGNFVKPELTHRLHRGDPMQKREVIEPGALSALGSLEFNLQLAQDESGSQSKLTLQLTEEQERRLALARWIAHPRNPLTARVMVNRLWHYHFGQGIVNTPSDFGLNGARPTHPELLEWLAAEFIAQGWRPKAIHRLILLSHTYRQASTPDRNALALDGSNTLLGRFASRRLEAEPIRDCILWVSGKLESKMGGPGYHVFEPNNNYVRVYNPKQEFGPGEWRRMIYQYKPRMQQDATFGTFDCPDGGQIAPRRTSSTTPLQALNLLHSRFMLQQAEFFAQRLQREAGREHGAQVQRAFQLAFGREAAREEAAAALKLIQEHNLNAFCLALFNANEFLYLF